jgi:hypothetical protein
VSKALVKNAGNRHVGTSIDFTPVWWFLRVLVDHGCGLIIRQKQWADKRPGVFYCTHAHYPDRPDATVSFLGEDLPYESS